MKVVFEESIKESDGHAIMTMLRRVRVLVDSLAIAARVDLTFEGERRH